MSVRRGRVVHGTRQKHRCNRPPRGRGEIALHGALVAREDVAHDGVRNENRRASDVGPKGEALVMARGPEQRRDLSWTPAGIV